MSGRELLGNAMDEFIAGDYSATADTPSGAELIRRADAEPVLRAALEMAADTLETLHKAAVLLGLGAHRTSVCNDESDGCYVTEALRTIAALTTPDAPG